MNKIVVIGSLNMDIVVEVERLPNIGETMHGKDLYYFIGGKGANQAVAAARMGNPTLLLGCVGQDSYGKQIRNILAQEETLIIDKIGHMKDTSTGLAFIYKTKEDNAITIIGGANQEISVAYIDKHKKEIQEASIVLLQLEIPIPIIEHIVALTKSLGVKTILNPAPYQTLPKSILQNIEYITPNETECAAMLGVASLDTINLQQALVAWEQEYQTKVIVTMGKAGAVYLEDNSIVSIPAPAVKVVDTTGAGDTLNGILAYSLAQGQPLQEALTLAVCGASLATQSLGAQSGMPTLKEINEYTSTE